MSNSREQLSIISRKAGEVFKVSDAAAALSLSNAAAAKRLAVLAKQGWLNRIQRGLYSIAPLDSNTNNQALEDPWILVPELFSPCYIAGWSAAEYWDLTEQIFNNICVVTEANLPFKNKEVYGNSFVVTRIKHAAQFGTKVIWRQNKKILISDIHKTIIDMMYDPSLGGGIQHVTKCFQNYLKHSKCNLEILIEYAEYYKNGAVYKRLGFLCEIYLGKKHLITKLCLSRITSGNSYLDSKIKATSLVSRWNLFVPIQMKEVF